MSYLAVPPPLPQRRRTAAAWVLRALVAVLLAGVVTVAVQMYSAVADHSPQVVYKGADEVAVTVSTDKFSEAPQRKVIVRVTNGTDHDVDVRARVALDPEPPAAAPLAGTITAALTVAGTEVRSGELDGLTSPDLHLEPGATAPVTVEVTPESRADEHTWARTTSITLTVTSAN